jgi:TetR/AcrR family transcriptional repressor of bet genes
MMDDIAATASLNGRRAPRDMRRQQLIEATIGVLARKGYAALTIADVAGVAGLSVGIVNFHFDSEDNLLAEYLRDLLAEYTNNWKTVLVAAEPNAARRLEAVLLADFNAEFFTPSKIADSIAFWGETQGRPVYDEICAALDAEHEKMVERLCAEIIAEGGYGHDAAITARALESLGDGLWLGIGTWRPGTGTEHCPAAARDTLKSALAAYFPAHFRQ